MAAPQSFKDPIMNQEREALERLQQSVAEPCKMVGSLLFCQVRQADLELLLALRSGGEGWQLMPVEPTGAMLLRGCDAAWPGPECVYDDAFDGPEHQLQAAYRAMLAAAPPPPSIQGEG